MSRRDRRRKKSRGRPNAPQPKKEPVDLPPLPDRRALESVMADLSSALGGTGKRGPVDDAQELMYEAWDAADPEERVRLARKALEISPDCADLKYWYIISI